MERLKIWNQTNSVWYGSSVSCHIALPESFEVQASIGPWSKLRSFPPRKCGNYDDFKYKKFRLTENSSFNHNVFLPYSNIFGSIFFSKKSFIATLGSILDFHQSWQSGKYKLARWRKEVVIYPGRTTHYQSTHLPRTHQTTKWTFVKTPTQPQLQLNLT